MLYSLVTNFALHYSFNILFMKSIKLLLVCAAISVCVNSYSQKAPGNTRSATAQSTPFDFLTGNWIVYNNESALAAYNKFEPIAEGKGIAEQYQNRKGGMSMGIIYQDPVTNKWMHTWVSDNVKSFNPVGTRQLQPNSDQSNRVYQFYGESVINGKVIRDRVVFNHISQDSLQKRYEVSTDNGRSWDCEFKETFKRVK